MKEDESYLATLEARIKRLENALALILDHPAGLSEEQTEIASNALDDKPL